MEKILAGARFPGQCTIEDGKAVITCPTVEEQEAVLKAINEKDVTIAVPPKKHSVLRRMFLRPIPVIPVRLKTSARAEA